MTSLPFDTMRRFSVLRDILGRLGLSPRASVLDVGGHPGTLAAILRQAHPEWIVHTVDSKPDTLPDYTTADGARLPFEDGAFDAVVTSDCLEHVPPDARANFLGELARVSRDAVVVGAPFHSLTVAAVERQLDDAHRALTGVGHPWLSEHVANGLPDLSQTVAQVAATRAVDLYAAAPLLDWVTIQWAALVREVDGDLDADWNALNAARDEALDDSEVLACAGLAELPFHPYRWIVVGRAAAAGHAPTIPAVPPTAAPTALGGFLSATVQSLAKARRAAASGDAAIEIDERLRSALEHATSELTRVKKSGSRIVRMLGLGGSK